MSMVKWSDFIPPEYAPVAYGLGAAAAGGGLGWLYDKLRGKKHTARRIGIGALLGLLGGAGYGQSVLNDHLVNRDNDNANKGYLQAKDEERNYLRRIASAIGVNPSEIVQREDPTGSVNSDIRGAIVEKLRSGGADQKTIDDFVYHVDRNVRQMMNGSHEIASRPTLQEALTQTMELPNHLVDDYPGMKEMKEGFKWIHGLKGKKLIVVDPENSDIRQYYHY